MNFMAITVAFLAGVLLAGLPVFLLFRLKVRAASESAAARAEGEKALLEQRAEIAEQAAAAHKANLDTQIAHVQDLTSRLHQETGKRSAAEERAARLPELEQKLENLAAENSSLRGELAELRTRAQEEKKAADEKLALIEDARTKLSDAFKALSSEALRSNNQSFLEMARTQLEKFQNEAKVDLDKRGKAIDDLVKPVGEALKQVDEKLGGLEKERLEAYSGLREQVKALALSQAELKSETGRLVQALRRPQVRGRWGEMQLRRVVEMAGMLNYCDFIEQESSETAEGRLRPDMVVKLPGGRSVVVDAKAPLEAYLNALECQDEDERDAYMKAHAQQIAAHVRKLGAKRYFDQFENTPDFVVLFLPGETFFSAALQQNPGLIEEGVSQRVICASPTTLIALLRAVAYGWKQEEMAESARQVADLGKELYERLGKLAEHLGKTGTHLGRAVDSYNQTVGSLESRVLVSARKFPELGVLVDRDIAACEPLDNSPRALSAPEAAGEASGREESEEQPEALGQGD